MTPEAFRGLHLSYTGDRQAPIRYGWNQQVQHFRGKAVELFNEEHRATRHRLDERTRLKQIPLVTNGEHS